MSGELLIDVSGVSKKFCRSLKRSLWYGVKDMAHEVTGSGSRHDRLRKDEFWAVHDVSFQLHRGECLGLIGHNGAGKTTLLRMLNGLIKPDRGHIQLRGRVNALIALGAGFNPLLSGRENIYVNSAVLGLTKRETDELVDGIIDFSGLHDLIDAPVQTYSSGMQVRLGFAVATSLKPDILILDEVLAVGDAAFRTRCFHRIGQILTRAAVVFVSHDDIQVRRICNTVMYLSRGKQRAIGEPTIMLAQYAQDNLVPPRPSLIVDEGIKACEIHANTERIRAGDHLSLTIRLDSETANIAGLALVTLGTSGSWSAQADVTHIVDHLPAGVYEIDLALGPIHLSEGEYTVSLTILDQSKKKTLVHHLHGASFTVDGRTGWGVPYQVPATAVAASRRLPLQPNGRLHD